MKINIKMEKNIFLLSTPSFSRLQLKMDGNFHIENGQSIPLKKYQHLYIVSDEKIEEGDWFILDMSHSERLPNELHQMGPNKWSKTGGINFSEPNSWTSSCKKIILTTDPRLYPGVQKINDEFLEWFVKNPSCEEVEIKDSKIVKEHIWDGSNDGEIIWEKEIIIPKEKPEEETLEEAAERLYPDNIVKLSNETSYNAGLIKRNDFIEGGKWQQERMYSEEEVKHIVSEALESALVTVDLDQWFEQFKRNKNGK